MTVIAWDGKTLAADKRVTQAGLARTSTKILRAGHLLVASYGTTNTGLELVEWFKQGHLPSTYPEHLRGEKADCCLLVVEHGRCRHYDGSHMPVVYEDPFYATGSGRDYALAAMACGKTAAEAVEIACRFDVNCGNGIDMLEAE